LVSSWGQLPFLSPPHRLFSGTQIIASIFSVPKNNRNKSSQAAKLLEFVSACPQQNKVIFDKPGYRLEFGDNFQAETLDTSKWWPFYLPQWSNRNLAAVCYSLPGHCLKLHIEAEYDDSNRPNRLRASPF
jgi:hypothetical protein